MAEKGTGSGEVDRSSQVAEAAREAQENRNTTPGTTWFQRWRTRMLLLAAIAGVTTLPDHDHCQGFGSDIVDTENEQAILQVVQGGQRFSVYRTSRVTVSDKYGSTLSHFIAGQLTEKNLVPDGMADLTLINAIIVLCHNLNPALDLDNFQAVQGAPIQFPDYIVAENLGAQLTATSGYSALQDAAEKDGFNVRDAGQQQSNYDKALSETVEIPTSTYYFRKADDVDYSPNKLYPDALEKLEDMGKKFQVLSDGWTVSYTDALVSPREQENRYQAINAQRKKNGEYQLTVAKDTTHTTGRTIDVPNGRFKTPEGVEITYTGNPEHQDKIINQLRPWIIQAALESGIMVYEEGNHYHIYMPGERDEQIAIIDFGFRRNFGLSCARSFQDGSQDGYEDGDRTRTQAESIMLEPTDFDKKVESVFADLTEDHTYWDSARVETELGTIRAEVSYHTLLSQYMNLDPRLEDLYGDWSDEALQNEINRISGLKAKKKAEKQQNKAKISDLSRVRDFRTFNPVAIRLLEIVRHMSPADIEKHKIFRGSVFDNPRKHPFYDLKSIWEWKRDNKGKSRDKEKYNFVIDDLKGKDHSVDLADWFVAQKAACDYFQRNHQRLGFDSEMSKYITPAVMFAVIHAEFVSEFSGEMYFELAPVLFPSTNLVYGPAISDTEFSGGVVQMTGDTFNLLLNRRYESFAAMQATDSDYDLRIPAVTEEHKNREGKVVRREFDTHEFTRAMVTHLPTHLFFAAVVTADHIEPGFQTLMADKNFHAAWSAASEEERYVFMGSFAAMAINSGPGTKADGNGAIGVVKTLLARVNATNLRDYSDNISDSARAYYGGRGMKLKAKTTDSNADRGHQTMQEFVRREVDHGVVEQTSPADQPSLSTDQEIEQLRKDPKFDWK